MTKTASDPHGTHDWYSQEYVDHWISSDATRDDERRPLLEHLATYLPFDRQASVRILDVGAGYGMLSRAVLDALPNCTMVLHDFSEPMTGHARTRLQDAAERITFAYSDLRESSWVDVLEGPFDAVVSSLAIHNVRTPARIREVYAEIHPLVAPGGCFYNIDQVRPAGPLTSAAMWPGRRYTAEEGETSSLVDHLVWLRSAGFDEADCLLRDGWQTLVGGFRVA